MAASVSASIAIGDSVTALTTLATGTLTPTGTNKVIYVLVGSGATSPNNPSAVKYASVAGVGGESLTLLDSTRTIATNVKQSIYKLVAPSAASGTIHVTWAGADDERWIIAVAVQDADGTEGAISYATGTSSAPSVAPASTSGELVLDFLSILNGGGSGYTLDVGAGQTSIRELEGSGTGGTTNISGFESAGSSRETAGGASTTMSWTISSNSEWGIHAFQVNPAAAPAATFPPVPRPFGPLPTLVTM